MSYERKAFSVRSGKIKIKVSKTVQKRILSGDPWVRFYQMKDRKVSGAAGDLGVVYDSANKFLAIGLFDPYSDIRLRILQTRKPVIIDRDFFMERLHSAAVLREGLEGGATTGYRLVNGENDALPGLVVDRYAETQIVKVYTSAWLPHLPILMALLTEEFGAQRLVLRLSRHVQKVDAGGYRDGQVLAGAPLAGPVEFLENGLRFTADVLAGQKTGFFLDQRDNRQEVRQRASGKTVLNVFSYSGGFSVYALAGECESVTELEISRPALDGARANAVLNFGKEVASSGRFSQIQGDAFEVLERLHTEGKTFDLVILDPPAFAKSKKDKPNALRAYQRLVQLGARVTSKYGILFAASCSAPVEADEFYRAVEQGLKSAGRTARSQIKTGHAPDHPVTFREGAYLKGVFLELSA
ncbi:SAM-dependent methyltransferase containing PUA domain [Nitrospina gracilis 3/211]|uniref:SAM-dependent methyltransferase containing PUA domain n=1 Tax=Nitrospina gracilis (strain 3/211) TaxID=1266370 RepID=M1ZEC4_NITG3|nr:class I SAM-dependent rRNA methyltransferase [Nitrospina sp. Nb-3]CCQ91909.1 SAM-dependent methyltransferase containing PUA domain [Nitrospina gracilis 3/211]